MERLLARLYKGLLLAAALGLGGCATVTPTYTTEAEVLAARGEPTDRRPADDGTMTLEYATQPEGTTCLMVQVDAGGKVVRQWDALASKNLARVRPGMSREAVSRLLGRHRSERVYPDTREEVWDWRIRHRGRGSATLFNVHFLDGRVRYTDRTRLYPDGEREEVEDWVWYPWYPFYSFGLYRPWLGIGAGRYWLHGGHRHSGGKRWHGSGRRWPGGRHFRKR
ncbi:MAG: outer membrane protein assembly factor BamE [Azoarcus sp.]|nr:outer membrane protein assembly factor BamE [Azoarcus sp.]